MATKRTQIFLVAPIRFGVGLTSVTLGIVRALQQLGVEARYVKPVAQGISDNSDHFARQILQIPVPEAISLNAASERIRANQAPELMEEIVSLCMNACDGTSVLFVEGAHVDSAHPFTTNLNVQIASSLKTDVVLVADASDENVAADLDMSIRQFQNAGCNVVGVVFNKVRDNFDKYAIHKKFKNLKLWGFIKENPTLYAPRTLDIARHLKAEIINAGEIAERRVLESVICARSVANTIPRMRPGALMMTSGDRDDVIIAIALAESRGIRLAGMLLTHDSPISAEVMGLAGPALTVGLPILRTNLDSFMTARRITHLPAVVPIDDIARMTIVIDTVAEDLDDEVLSAALQTPENTKLSPPAFRYQLIQKARTERKTIVLPEGEEPRTVRAAVICEEKGIAHCVLLGKREKIELVAAAQGIKLPDSLEIIDPDAIRQDYVAPMVELRKNKGLTPQQAVAQLEDTVVLGTMMLATDKVDGLVSGAVHTTASTVRPALQLIKTAPGSSIVSSIFFMLMPEQVLVYGDCAINPDPNAAELAQIAKQSAESAASFGITPRVAMISYSTGTSGTGEDVDKVREATQIAQRENPELLIDGPMQYDAASTMDVGMQKAPNSLVAGQATIFVFPDLNTGNTTYKAVQRSANVVSVGPMLQGLRKPVNDLSRGALVDDIVFTIALTAIQAQRTLKTSE